MHRSTTYCVFRCVSVRFVRLGVERFVWSFRLVTFVFTCTPPAAQKRKPQGGPLGFHHLGVTIITTYDVGTPNKV